jgi:exodeoxyribonuclease VII large subunit
LQAVGTGSIKKAQSLLEQKLAREGLFEESRKRSVPFPPTKIALVTSSESAAYSDFVKIIQARWSALEVELYEVQVQGQDAVRQIVEALQAINQHSDDLEAVVLIRGGGSRDDLVAFDHEQVVRAVAASRVPTVVAIGHERDVCLAELAADLRASTPSNAAELLVPDKLHEAQIIGGMQASLDDSLIARSSNIKTTILHGAEQLNDLLSLHFRQANQYVTTNSKLLRVLNPKQPLERGFALVRDKQGGIIRSARLANQAKELDLEFKDGTITTHVEKV